ncbi:MAG: DUF4162 domain-containing protein [Ignavibacteriaceae bacterium]
MEEAEYCNNIILINAGKLIAEGNAKELKTKYLKNPIYEIDCNNPVDALDLFQNEKFVSETSLFGNSLHVIVNNTFENEEQLRKCLAQNPSLQVKRIQKITPTLEDVFIHLLESSGSEK